MWSRLYSLGLVGLEGEIVEVECDIHRGIPSFTVVGLADTSIQESRERVRSALKQSGLEFPRGKIAINLAPADLKKNGPSFDLAIALSILNQHGQVQIPEKFQKAIFLGELSFSGELRSISGVLPATVEAKKLGFTHIFVPETNAEEASLVEGMEIFGIQSLRHIVDFFTTGEGVEVFPFTDFLAEKPKSNEADFRFVKGNEQAKRALEIAAAGGHNILMIGPPGSGKTMLSKAFSTILPDLTFDESLEITKIHSIAGLTGSDNPVLRERPFRSVHHTASGVAIVGGGNPPSPGEISLAHRGVLFLDEFAEFSAKTLEVLRQPLEDGNIRISRAAGSIMYPAQFSLVAAMNPCPCGFYGDPHKECTDSPGLVQRYRQKISGPILDRIDLHIEVPRVAVEKLAHLEEGESSEIIRNRVQKARDIQLERFKGRNIACNSEMSSSLVREYCALPSEAESLLKTVVEKMNLSGRSYFRLLKIARTIADLEHQTHIQTPHMAEAIQYRSKLEN